jgi:hypothetical protein
MLTPRRQEYHDSGDSTPLTHPIAFDLREPGGVELFHEYLDFYGEDGDVEVLDENHPVLLVRVNPQETGR